MGEIGLTVRVKPSRPVSAASRMIQRSLAVIEKDPRLVIWLSLAIRGGDWGEAT
jgi:hypothetical protein